MPSRSGFAGFWLRGVGRRLGAQERNVFERWVEQGFYQHGVERFVRLERVNRVAHVGHDLLALERGHLQGQGVDADSKSLLRPELVLSIAFEILHFAVHHHRAINRQRNAHFVRERRTLEHIDGVGFVLWRRKGKHIALFQLADGRVFGHHRGLLGFAVGDAQHRDGARHLLR